MGQGSIPADRDRLRYRRSACAAIPRRLASAALVPVSVVRTRHQPTSKRAPPSAMSARPGQFSVKLNPAPGLEGSKVGSGVAADGRLTVLSRPCQRGWAASSTRPAKTNNAPSKVIAIRASWFIRYAAETSSRSSRGYDAQLRPPRLCSLSSPPRYCAAACDAGSRAFGHRRHAQGLTPSRNVGQPRWSVPCQLRRRYRRQSDAQPGRRS